MELTWFGANRILLDDFLAQRVARLVCPLIFLSNNFPTVFSGVRRQLGIWIYRDWMCSALQHRQIRVPVSVSPTLSPVDRSIIGFQVLLQPNHFIFSLAGRALPVRSLIFCPTK